MDTKALATHFLHFASDASSLRESQVAAAVAKTRAELASLSSLEEADADERLLEVGREIEGLKEREAAFASVLRAVGRRVEEWESRERAEALALQSPPPLQGTEKEGRRGLVVRWLLLLLLALGLTEPAVHLFFVVARELPGWMGRKVEVVM